MYIYLFKLGVVGNCKRSGISNGQLFLCKEVGQRANNLKKTWEKKKIKQRIDRVEETKKDERYYHFYNVL